MKLLLIFVCVFLTVRCNTSRNIITAISELPTQAMLVSIAEPSVPSGHSNISTFAFPSNIPIVQSSINLSMGVNRPHNTRPQSSPGISANKDIYVVAYWGGFPGFNNLDLSVSENGREWNLLGSLLSASQNTISSSQVDDNSIPSLTFFPKTQTWFMSFRDAFNTNIEVDQFSILKLERTTTTPFGNTNFESRLIRSTSTNHSTDYAPSLGFKSDSLVMGFTPRNSNQVFLSTSADGVSFGASVSAIDNRGTPIICNAGSPYFHNSLGSLYLATAVERAFGRVDIQIWRSDSTSVRIWTPVRTLTSVTGTSTGRVNPAIAGPESEMLVSHPSNSQNGTTVWIGNRSIELSNSTRKAVGLAYGPGPSFTATLSCNQSILRAIGQNVNENILSNETKIISTFNGNISFLCGSSDTINAGCSSNTSRVVVRRGNAPSDSRFFIECWRR